jgi:hypothetical protein
MLTLVFAGDAVPSPLTGQKVNEWLDHRGEVIARAFSSGDLRWIDCFGVGAFGFSIGSHEVRVWPKPDSEHQTIVRIYSRLIKPLILQDMGFEILHAGAVLGSRTALAFCGRSGSGKSTLAFAMQLAGWRQLSDDVLVLRIDRCSVLACPLPFMPRLRSASLAHFARVRAVPSPSVPNAEETPLAAIFVLRPNAALVKPRVSLLPQTRAFSELLDHAERFDAEDQNHTRRLLESYLEVAARVPVYTLEYRPSFQDLSELIRAVMEVAGGSEEADCTSELYSVAKLS